MSNRYVIKNGFLSRGNSQITGSLIGTTDIEAKGSIIGNEMKMVSVSGSNSKLHFTGSVYSSIHLEVLESGSVSFESQGSGSLFSIVDSMSGSLMSVNDISGLPILEVFSNDRVVAGAYNKNTFVVADNSVELGSLDTSGSIKMRGTSVRITGSMFVDMTGVPGGGYFPNSDPLNPGEVFVTSSDAFGGSGDYYVFCVSTGGA